MNGIIIDGKAYEVVKKANGNPCIDCELTELCGECILVDFCYKIGSNAYFRYSQSLTDKLNK